MNEKLLSLNADDALSILRALDLFCESGLLGGTGGAMDEPDIAVLCTDVRRVAEQLLDDLRPDGLAQGARVADVSTGDTGTVIGWVVFDSGLWEVHVDWDDGGVACIGADALRFT